MAARALLHSEAKTRRDRAHTVRRRDGQQILGERGPFF